MEVLRWQKRRRRRRRQLRRKRPRRKNEDLTVYDCQEAISVPALMAFFSMKIGCGFLSLHSSFRGLSIILAAEVCTVVVPATVNHDA
jgi:hypothetical protein